MSDVKILIVRHAQSTSNLVEALDTSIPGAGLTDVGRAQAALLAVRLAGEPIEAVYASPMTRTMLTAAALSTPRDLDILIRPDLREVSSGDLEMRTDSSARTAYDRTVENYARDVDTVLVPGGESRSSVLARFDRVVDEAGAAGHDCAAIVTHGAIVRAWCGARVSNLDVDLVFTHRLGNASVAVIVGSPSSGWEATTWDSRAVPPS